MDQCILCNSCWLCRGCEVTRLLPYGWHKDYCAARTQLCTSVLSRISGLCNDCIRLVTDIRTVQHAGLTADGLLGVRLVIYIGMLANHENLNEDQLYLIPNVLSASLDRYIGGSLDPTLWLQNPRSMQHRVQRTMSGDTVVEFILCMKRLLSCHGDLQHSCILCKKLLPTRWMIILCEGCEHTLIGGGGRDTLSPSGIQILCLLHRMVEDIHRRRLSGSSRTPSVMVDAITEGMVLAVIAGTETGGNWWLREPMVIVESPGGGGPPDGAPPSSPHWGAHSCPTSAAASSSVRLSEAVERLARLSETLLFSPHLCVGFLFFGANPPPPPPPPPSPPPAPSPHLLHLTIISIIHIIISLSSHLILSSSHHLTIS